MAGIRLWRCVSCEQVASVVVDGETTLLCGDCFYRKSVQDALTAASEAESCNTPDGFLHSLSDGPRTAESHRRLG